MKKTALLFNLILLTFILYSGTSPVKAQKTKARLALVIGNSTYKHSPLRNPANDARDMAAVLKTSGFKVTLLTNASQREMESAVRAFGKGLRNGGTGLFYYAGHGIQVRGRNYLIPIGATIVSETDVKYEAVDAGLVLGKMEDAENGLNIVILDACRNNPFARSFRSAEQGLARMDAPRGSLIAYATSPGSVAADGTDRNGVYTKHLIKHLQKPGMTIEEILKNVRIGVVKETGKKQIPWESSSLMGNFYFQLAKGSNVVIVPQADPRPKPPDRPTYQVDDEEEMWLLVKGSESIEDLDMFLSAYPNGRFKNHAKLRRSQLAQKKKSAKKPDNKPDKKPEVVRTSPASKKDFNLIAVRFFEAGNDSPDADKRDYKTSFPQETTKRIWTEVKVDNLRYNKKNHEHEIVWIYYKSDGGVFGRMERGFDIKKEWKTAWHQRGWGWSTPGNWPADRYRVVVYIDGNEIAEKNFLIMPSLKDYKIKDVLLFEAGDTVPKNKKRKYATSFAKSKVRRIYAEVKAKNYRYNQKTHTHQVEWIFYNSDGSVRGRMESDFTIKKEWKNARIQRGWGWKKAGYWPKGTYRVKVLVDNHNVSEKTFRIY